MTYIVGGLVLTAYRIRLPGHRATDSDGLTH